MDDPFDVAIVGAGMAGVGMAIRLTQSGLGNFVLLERAPQIGGTWRDNVYPGCSCDVPGYLYWYDFVAQPVWCRLYPTQPELLGALEAMSNQAGLGPRTRLGADVEAVEWDERKSLWRLSVAHGPAVCAKALIMACGQFGEPSYGAVRSRETFRGASFHSSRWPTGIDLAGRVVGVIGAGASAGQILPAVAATADRVLAFQRSPAYVAPRDDYAYSDEERAAFAAHPSRMRAARRSHFRDIDRDFEMLKTGSPAHRKAEAFCRAHLEAVVADEALRRRLWPTYALGCKRIIFSDEYLATFNRSNVELVSSPVVEICPQGVKTADGGDFELDVIVYATGFDVANFLPGVRVAGRGGSELHDEAWRDGPAAYLGLTVPGFPNFFVLYGPHTHSHGSITSMLEAQFEHTLQAVRRVITQDVTVEPREASFRAYVDQLRSGLSTSVFETGGCSSWHLDARGRVATNWWGRVDDYRRQTRRFALKDYDQRPRR